MKNTSEGDSQRQRFPALKATGIYVRIPNDRVFECGDEPVDVHAMAETVKEFIAEASTEIFTLELHVEWS
jgi:hypothetical protein